MVDWTQLTDDPNNAEAKEAVRRYLGSVRQVHLDVDLLPFIESLAAGRSVLIARAAKRCLGADIIESLVKELKARGYDVVCADAPRSTWWRQRRTRSAGSSIGAFARKERRS